MCAMMFGKIAFRSSFLPLALAFLGFFHLFNLCFRYKHNVTIREINQAVIKAILESVLEDKNLSKQSMVQELDKVKLFNMLSPALRVSTCRIVLNSGHQPFGLWGQIHSTLPLLGPDVGYIEPVYRQCCSVWGCFVKAALAGYSNCKM